MPIRSASPATVTPGFSAISLRASSERAPCPPRPGPLGRGAAGAAGRPVAVGSPLLGIDGGGDPAELFVFLHERLELLHARLDPAANVVFHRNIRHAVLLLTVCDHEPLAAPLLPDRPKCMTARFVPTISPASPRPLRSAQSASISIASSNTPARRSVISCHPFSSNSRRVRLTCVWG